MASDGQQLLRQRFRDEFDRLKAKGYEPTKIAAALMPIMLGQPVDDVVRVAEVSLQSQAASALSSSVSTSSPASAQPAAPAALPPPPSADLAASMLASGLDYPRLEALVNACRGAADWTPLIRFIGKAYSDRGVLAKSFRKSVPPAPAVSKPGEAGADHDAMDVDGHGGSGASSSSAAAPVTGSSSKRGKGSEGKRHADEMDTDNDDDGNSSDSSGDGGDDAPPGLVESARRGRTAAPAASSSTSAAAPSGGGGSSLPASSPPPESASASSSAAAPASASFDFNSSNLLPTSQFSTPFPASSPIPQGTPLHTHSNVAGGSASSSSASVPAMSLDDAGDAGASSGGSSAAGAGAGSASAAAAAKAPALPAVTVSATPPMSLCPIDVKQVFDSYALILRVASEFEAVGAALFNATVTLSASVSSAAPSFRPGPEADTNLAPIFILSCNPALEDPQYHESVVTKLCRAHSRLQEPLKKQFSHWFATADGAIDSSPGTNRDHEMDEYGGPSSGSASSSSSSLSSSASASSSAAAAVSQSVSKTPLATALIRGCVDWLQQYITLLLISGNKVSTNDVGPPVEFLGAINTANELIHDATGHRAVPYQSFYNQVISGEGDIGIDLARDHERWMQGRASSASSYSSAARSSDAYRNFSFCAHPYILDAAAKSKVLEADAKEQMSREYAHAMFQMMFGMGTGGDDRYFQLRVRRDHLIEDALRGIVQIDSKRDLRKPLKVTFQGEEGLDAGGVRKEFFTLITRTLFSPEFGMFEEFPETKMLWFKKDSIEPPINFELIGSLIGLALYNAVILDLNMPVLLYRRIKGDHLSLRDLDDFQPQLASSLRSLLAYEGEDFESVFCLSFSVDYESWGEKITHDLIPGGASVAVTKANVRDYVRAYLNWLYLDSVKPQYDAFDRGFRAVVGGPALELFRAEELAAAIVGNEELDFEALEKAAQYEAPYTKDHPVVRTFWSVVHSLSADDKKKFLHFSTGTDRAPLRGLGSIPFIVTREPDSERLITSHTCFNHVVVPEYPTREKLETKLKMAIEQSEGFGLI